MICIKEERDLNVFINCIYKFSKEFIMFFIQNNRGIKANYLEELLDSNSTFKIADTRFCKLYDIAIKQYLLLAYWGMR